MEPAEGTGPTSSSTAGTGTGAGTPAAAPVSGIQQFFDALRRTDVRRPTDDRWVGGVCSGTARRLGVDPVLLRVAAAALVLLGGAGVVAYALALLLLPDHDGRIELERASRGDLTGTTVGAVALLLLAMVVPAPWDLWRGDALVDGGEVVGALLVGTLLVIGLAYLPRLREAVERGSAPAPTGATSATSASGATSASWAPGATTPAAPAGQAYGPWAARSPQPPAPRPLPRPQRRGPGPALASAVTGTALAVGGAVWLAADAGLLLGRPWLLGACAALTVLGLGLVGLGVAGRRDGSVGGAAFFVLVATAAVLLVPSWRTTQLAGDVTWTPTTASVAERGGSLGLGEAVLDLTALTGLPDGAAVDVPVRVGIGGLVVQVPEDMDVVVRAGTVIGSTADAAEDGSREGRGGVAVERTLADDPDPQVVVDARVLIGDVELVRVQR